MVQSGLNLTAFCLAALNLRLNVTPPRMGLCRLDASSMERENWCPASPGSERERRDCRQRRERISVATNRVVPFRLRESRPPSGGIQSALTENRWLTFMELSRPLSLRSLRSRRSRALPAFLNSALGVLPSRSRSEPFHSHPQSRAFL
jgi:hypothetical protein